MTGPHEPGGPAAAAGGGGLPLLDVRPDIAAGNDPLERILDFVDSLRAAGGGIGFVLEAPFDPKPLRRLLATQGFDASARQLGPQHWQVEFRAPPQDPRCWRDGDGLHVDVRGLAPPEPLLRVLARLGDAGAGDAVVVHHDRDPLLLYPELAQRGWSAECVEGEAGEVRLRLTRAAPGAASGP
jgi:uncharacterized protein (DUF2249 family)